MKKHWATVLVVLLIATPTRGDPSDDVTTEFPECGPCNVTEPTMLIVLLNDPVLRDVVCRLSTQAFEPGALANAIGLKDRADVVQRINTLRRWGLVRMARTEWGTKVAEVVPGKGEETLRRWTEKYCFNPGSCGTNE